MSVLSAGPSGSALVEKAKALYGDLDYEECLRTAGAASQRELSDTERVDLYVTQGLCEIQLRRLDAARLSFARSLEVDPAAALPRYAPPAAREQFALAQQQTAQRRASQTLKAEPLKPEPLKPELAALTDEAKEFTSTLASEPSQVAGTRPSLQTYRPWPARFALGGASVGGLVAGIGLLASAHDLAARARNEPFQSTHLELGSRATTLQTWSFVATGIGLSLALSLVLHEVWLRSSP